MLRFCHIPQPGDCVFVTGGLVTLWGQPHTPGQTFPSHPGGAEPWPGAEPSSSATPRFVELFSCSSLAALDPVIATPRDISIISKQNKEGHPRATSHGSFGHAGAPLKVAAKRRILLQAATNECSVLLSTASKINTRSIPRPSSLFFPTFSSLLVSQFPIFPVTGWLRGG